MRRAAVVAAAAGLALAGCGGGDDKPAGTTPPSTTPATSSGARAAVRAFYKAAWRGNFPAACALLAPQADAPETTANLMIATSGNTFIKLGTDCESTLSALANSQSRDFQEMLVDIRTPHAAAPGKVDISGDDRRMTFHATLVQVGGAWRILEVVP